MSYPCGPAGTPLVSVNGGGYAAGNVSVQAGDNVLITGTGTGSYPGISVHVYPYGTGLVYSACNTVGNYYAWCPNDISYLMTTGASYTLEAFTPNGSPPEGWSGAGCGGTSTISVVACVPSYPSKPGLLVPSNNGLVGPLAHLAWVMAPGSGWGTECPTNNTSNDQFELYLDTNPTPTTRVATFAPAQTSIDRAVTPDTKYYWRVAAFNGTLRTYSDTWSFTVAKQPFFQVGGGGNVTASDALSTWLPSGKMVSASDGLNTPGLGVARSFSGVTRSNISSQGWLVAQPEGMDNILSIGNYSYDKMYAHVTGRITPVTLSGGNLDQTALLAAIDAAGPANKFAGVTILAVNGSLGLTGNINLGGRKALVFVNGNTSLSGNLNLDNDSGFLAVFTRNDTFVAATVGSGTYEDITAANYPPHLEGIYYSGGTFTTLPAGGGPGTDKQLRIDGTIIGLGGVSLQRDSLEAALYPAEFVSFRPDLMLTLAAIGMRNSKFYQQTAP